MDVVTLSIAKNYAKSLFTNVMVGVKSHTVDNTNKTITFVFNDDSTETIQFDQPKDGISIKNVEIDADNHIICTLSDYTKIDAGQLNIDTEELRTDVDTLKTDVTNIESELDNKQNKLTAGNNITISSTGVISATGGSGEGTGSEDHENRITSLEEQMAELLYKAITINSFNNNVNTVEKGTIITNVTLTWSTNKTPTKLVVNGETLSNTTTSKTITGLSLTSDKSYSMTVTDERNATATKTTSITFTNGIYYGSAAEPTTIDSTFILGLTKKLQSSKATTFTTNCGTGQYIYYAIPKSYGNASFNVGGFDGGFMAAETVSFTNSKGYTEDYYIYRSTNSSLGSTTVKVS